MNNDGFICRYKRSNRLQKKGGAIIAFIGIDGSGKSTIVDRLYENLLSRKMNIKKEWCGFEDWFIFKPVFKFLRRFFRTPPNDMSAEERYTLMRNRLRNKFIRFAYYLFVSIDYIFQLTIKVTLPKKSGLIILCDRYFIDQAITFSVEMEAPSLFSFFLIIFSFFLPKPTLAYVVFVSPKTSLNRKSDIPSIEYIEKRLRVYERIVSIYNYKSLNGELDINFNINKIIRDIENSDLL